DLTLRAGINHAKSPIGGSQTTFNLLAPGVVDTHLTLGATWKLNNGMSVTGAYMHAFENEVKGNAAAPPTGAYDVKMYQDSLGIAVSWDL
ncbi:MAG: long-chain fatty acid transporter, partial [bacterium]|nr:long-chain fatty acid transporter [bacterium]